MNKHIPQRTCAVDGSNFCDLSVSNRRLREKVSLWISPNPLQTVERYLENMK
jgi:hypothetical protein